MLEVAKFSAVHKLRDGRQVEIRAIRREDRDGFVEAVSRASDELPPPPLTLASNNSNSFRMSILPAALR
jgi:hypothetical protein